MDAASRREHRQLYQNLLLQDCLPFWQKFGIDDQHGGVLTGLDRDGTLIDSDKGIWQQARCGWLFAKMYNDVAQESSWLAIAHSCVDFLERHGSDPDDGRLWFQVTRQGEPLRKRRYSFSEAFAAIAYGELALATQNEQRGQRAIQLAEQFLRNSTQPVAGFAPKFTSVRPAKSIAVPMIALVTAQELRQSVGWERADAIAEQSILEIERDFVCSQQRCVLEIVSPQGQPLEHFDGRTLNPGHAIEAAWFILREASHRGESAWRELGCRMLDWMWERGWDPQYGGLMSLTSVDGRPIQETWHDMKFWWPHNEAIIATLMAYRLTGQPRYAQWHDQVHRWSLAHFADPQHGEWFGYLHRDGTRSSSLKGNLWKGPFHLPRMLWTCWKMLEDW